MLCVLSRNCKAWVEYPYGPQSNFNVINVLVCNLIRFNGKIFTRALLLLAIQCTPLTHSIHILRLVVDIVFGQYDWLHSFIK